MTRPRFDQENKATEFSEWLRRLSPPLDSSRIDNENIDYVWFDYRGGWFILIEEKRHYGSQTSAQADTHGIVNQFLTAASSLATPVETMRGSRRIEYRGYYLVRFSDTCPDDSTSVTINAHTYTSPRDAVLTLLRCGCQPDDCVCCGSTTA